MRFGALHGRSAIAPRACRRRVRMPAAAAAAAQQPAARACTVLGRAAHTRLPLLVRPDFSARFQTDVRCWSQSTLLLQHLFQLSRRARRRASAFSLHLGPLGVDGDRPLNFESRLTNARPPSQLAHLATGGTGAIVRAVCVLTRGCWISAEQSIAWAAPRTSHGSLASCIQPGWQRFERSIFATVAAAAK